MKKNLRWTALFVACVMLFSACGAGATSSASTSSAAPASAPAGESQAVAKYPSEQVITWYVQDAGNVTDTIARIVGPALGEELGQTVVIENAGGAGGMNELNPVLAADANGYSIASLAVAFLCLTPFSADCAYDYTNFEMLYNIFSQPQVLVVSADAPYNTFEEWKAYVEENPGTFRFGVPGASTVHNLCLQGLKLETELDYSVINYSTAAEVVAALMGGHIEGLVLGYSECMTGIENGDFKILAFTTQTKDGAYPDVPSLTELGYTSKGVAFQGVCMKAGTDPAITAKLKTAFDKVFADPEVIEQLKAADAWVDGTFQEGEEFTQTVKDTYEFYEDVLTQTGLMEQLYG